MLNLKTTKQYRKDRKTAIKRGLPMNLLDEILDTLLKETPLAAKHRDHALTGNYAGFRECHIAPDWLLIYAVDKGNCTIVDAPEVSLAPGQKAGELLLNFYRALGWNGEDELDPIKVRTTKEVFDRLYDQIYELCYDSIAVSMLMANSGPGTEDYIPPGTARRPSSWTCSPNKSKRRVIF